MNLKIFQIHCMPLTSNHFIYPPFQEIQYNYYILDISNLFFNKDRLKKYKHNSKLKKYPNCLYINIKNRQKLKKILKKYINDKTLFLFDDIISVDLFWLLKFIEKFNSKIYLPYKVAQLDKTKSNLNKISDSLSSLKYLKHMIPKVPLLFKRLIYSKTNFYMKPDILFTPGNSYGYWERNINPKKIISINSPQILLKKEKKIRRLVYIDEFQIFNRDNALFNLKPIIFDLKKYYQEINNFLLKVRNELNIEIIVACSDKHFYKKNPYDFEVIYGETKQLINSSQFIIGHDSDALFQSVYSGSKILLITSSLQIKVKNQKTLNMANLIGCKTLNISDKRSINISGKFLAPKRKEILKKYFLSKTNLKENHTLTVAKHIYSEFI